MTQTTIEDVLKKHISFQGKTDDKWWLQSSIKHFSETGFVTGSLHDAITAAMTEWASLNKGAVAPPSTEEQDEMWNEISKLEWGGTIISKLKSKFILTRK